MSQYIMPRTAAGCRLFHGPFNRALFDTRHRSPGYVCRPNRSA